MDFFDFLFSKNTLCIRRISQVLTLGILVTIVSSCFYLNPALANTRRVQFFVNANQQQTAFGASVLLTTDNNKKIKIDFEDRIRPGESDGVSLEDKQINVVTVKYQWRPTNNITYFAERRATPGNYYTLCDFSLRNITFEDRNIRFFCPESELPENDLTYNLD